VASRVSAVFGVISAENDTKAGGKGGCFDCDGTGFFAIHLTVGVNELNVNGTGLWTLRISAFVFRGEIMKIFWLNAGLYFEPENDQDSDCLAVLAKSLNIVDVHQSIPTGPICGNLRDQDAIIGVHKFS
jgi:hypothetical protein